MFLVSFEGNKDILLKLFHVVVDSYNMHLRHICSSCMNCDKLKCGH